MLNVFKACITSIFILFLPIIALAASPMGYWKTIDDVTGRPKGIVKIFGNRDYISGTVVKTFPGALTICSACSGNLKGKPIVGMTVMHGLKQEADDPNVWSGGTIMDPKTGQVYRCTINVSNDGSQLKVRGYIGFSLFGRTQTWVRVHGV